MPIRIEDIPNFQHTRLNQATMDTRVAGAPGHALEGLAAEIAKVSQPFADIAHRIQDADNERLQGKIEEELEAEYTAIRKKYATDPANPGYLRDIDALRRKGAARLEQPGVPPAVRDRLRAKQERMARQGAIQAAEDGSNAVLAQGRGYHRKRMSSAITSADREEVRRQVDRAKQGGLLTESQGRQEVEAAENEIHHQQQLHTARTDPNSVLARPDPGQREIMQAAKGASISLVAERGQIYQDELSRGRVHGPDDIDALMPLLTEEQKAPYKAHLAWQGLADADPAVRKQAASTDSQRELVGHADVLLAAFDAEDADAPVQLARLQTLMQRIHPADSAQPRLQAAWQRILNHEEPLLRGTAEDRRITFLSGGTREELSLVKADAIALSATRRKGAPASPGAAQPPDLTAEEEDGMISRQLHILRNHAEVMERVQEITELHKGVKDGAYLAKLDAGIAEVRQRQLIRRTNASATPAPPLHTPARRVAVPPAFATAEGSTHFPATRAGVERQLSGHGLHFAPHQVDALTSFQEDTGALEKLLSPDGKTFRTPADIADALLRYRNTAGERDPVKETRRLREQSLFLHGR